MPLLKLLALDADDLEIMSAHLQDAVVKVKDMIWQGGDKRFVAALCRFAWEAEICDTADKDKSGHVPQRHLSALRFDRVLSVRATGIDRGRPEDVLSLLALQFSETEAPGGIIELVFAGQAALRLEVECIEAQLADLGPVWQAGSCPCHDG